MTVMRETVSSKNTLDGTKEPFVKRAKSCHPLYNMAWVIKNKCLEWPGIYSLSIVRIKVVKEC